MASLFRNPIPPPPVQTGTDGTPVVPVPITPDVITRLNASANVEQNSGETTVLDVFPDFRFPLSSWSYSLVHSVQGSAYASHPLATPASVLAYTMVMFAGLLFCNDAFLRPSPSQFAFAVLNDSMFRLVYESLLDLAVPSFAHAEFSAHMPHFDELATNLRYFSTLAGSSFLHDISRMPPITVFTSLHNILAQLPANTTPAELFATFYSTTVAQITAAGLNNNDVNLNPAHLLGHYYVGAQNAINRHDNWLNFFIDQFLSANSIRVANASATVTRLSMRLPTRTTIAEYNPYLYLLGLHFDTVSPILELVRNLNDFVKVTWPSSRPLRSYTQLGTQEIVRHLTCECALPTWHFQTTPSKANLTALHADGMANVFSPAVAPSDYAAFIHYLAARPAPAATTTPASVTITQGIQTPDPLDTGLLIQLALSATGAPADDPAGIRSFDNRRHTNPKFVIFDPSSSNTAHLSSVITSGKVIETNDISAIGIPLATPLRPLGTTNSEHILGAIPFSKIQTAITGLDWTVRRRNWNTMYRTPQMLWKSLPNQVILPFFRSGLVRPTVTNTEQPNVNLDSFLPGARFLRHARHAHDGLNVFAYALGEDRDSIPESFFQVWSSYRYYDQESRTWYMLPSLRHIYGTRSRHFISEHIATRLH